MPTVKVTREVDVDTLVANIGVRYWDDGELNGKQDENGDMPLRNGDMWNLKIDLSTGQIKDWPKGDSAYVHYKVCDAGDYSLYHGDDLVVRKCGYVPSMLSPGGNGYGDYVIMSIDEDGIINNWHVDLEYFEEDDY